MESTQPVDLDDKELLALMFSAKNGPNVEALWNGDKSKYLGVNIRP